MRSLLVALVVAAPAAAPGVALADYDPLAVDRYTTESVFAFDFGYEVIDDNTNLADTTVMTFALAGQYVTPQGLGGYVAVPLHYISIENPIVDDSELALGNIELGGLFVKGLQGSTNLVFHGGLALPTADDDGVGALGAGAASIARWSDLVQRVPNTTWLRLGVSPMGRSGGLFWRADVGIDLALDDDANAGDISPVFRINGAIGFDLGAAQIAGELANTIIDNDNGDDSASTLTLGARFVSGNLRPGLGLTFPLGFDNDENLDFIVVASLAAHLQ